MNFTFKTYTPMKQAFILFVAISLFSCSGKKTQDEIKAEIASYKEEIASIQSKIKALEDQLSDSSKAQTNLKIVSIEAASHKTFEHFIEIQGKLDGDNNVGVYAEAPGAIKSILVKEGQNVTAGQTIALLNSSAGQEQIKALESQLKLATDVYNRQKNLWDQKIGSEIQYLTSKTQKEALESQVSSVRKQLEMYQITAPVSGTVEDLNIKVGQMAGPQMPVCKIVNFSTLKAKAEVAESYTSQIKLGDDVKIYITDLQQEVTAKIDYVSRFINPVNRTFTIEAPFEGNNTMKANMIAVVKINDYKCDTAFVIPINMIQTDNTGSYVFVIKKEGKKSIVRKQFITTGQTYNGMAEVIKGITKGDLLITTGYLTIEAGEEVVIK